MVQRTTLHDVARAAGVSVSTVSLVLRERGKMAPATRDRVKAIAKELGYHPNPVAVALKRGRGNIIAVVLSAHDDSSRARAFEALWGVVLNACAAEAARHGFGTLIVPPQQLEILDSVAVEMVLVFDLVEGQPTAAALADRGLPLAGGSVGDARFKVVFATDQAGMNHAAMNWLVSQGCQRPMLLVPKNPRSAGQQHLSALEQWRATTGASADVQHVDLSGRGVEGAVAEAIERGADGIFSLVGTKATITSAIRAAGRESGSGVKAVIYEDPAATAEPGIALIGYGPSQMGVAAAKACIEFLESAGEEIIEAQIPWQLQSV